jgi:hypothetical protein
MGDFQIVKKIQKLDFYALDSSISNDLLWWLLSNIMYLLVLHLIRYEDCQELVIFRPS